MKNLIACFVVCVFSCTAVATTWTVDDDGKADFNNIQAAIDASSNGDDILVMPGTYSGSGAYQVFKTWGKAVWIHSSDGPEVTVVDGEGSRRGFLCTTEETNKTIIDGFTITNASGTTGGGVTIFNSSPSINNCIIVNNTTLQNGGGIYVYNGSPIVTNCTISFNHADNSGGGIQSINSSSMSIADTVICGNTPDQVSGGFDDGGGNTIAEFCALDADWTVDDDGNDNPNADFDNIQDAINAATNGDEILVFPGTYTSVDNQVVDMLGKSIWLHSSNGADVTIIDAEDSRRGILCENNEPQETIIEGFTITGGIGQGAGIYCHGSSSVGSNPTITDCKITGNHAGQWNNGGGIGCLRGNPTIIGCQIINNSAYFNGAGIYLLTSSPSLQNCSIESNDSTSSYSDGVYCMDSSPIFNGCSISNHSGGSGLWLESGSGGTGFLSNPTLTKCDILNNSSVWGGGITLLTSSSVTLQQSDVSYNSGSRAGAIYCEDSSNVNLIECTVSHNTNSGNHGGIYCYDNSTVSLVDSTVAFNITSGGLSYGGGITIRKGSTAIVSGCSVNNNMAKYGGGIYASWDCTLNISNSDISYNEAIQDGGGVWSNNGGSLSLSDSSVVNNIYPDNNSWGFIAGVPVLMDGTLDLDDFANGGASIEFSAGTDCLINSRYIQGGYQIFNFDDLEMTKALVLNGTFYRNGSLVIANESNSLNSANVGDVFPIIQANSIDPSIPNFNSYVFPTLPVGVGLQIIEYTSSDSNDTEIAAEVIEVESAQYSAPFVADLDSLPMDIESFDADGFGGDEVAILYDGNPGGVVVFALSEDGVPIQINGFSALVGNNPVDLDAGDLNGDGLDDLIVSNGEDGTVTVLVTYIDSNGSLSFIDSTINSSDTLTSVAVIDWDADGDLDAVVGVDVTNPALNDEYQVFLDVADNATSGPSFAIPKYDLNPDPQDSEWVSDMPTCVDGGDQTSSWGFVGGTRYGRIHRVSPTNGLQVAGELLGNNIMTIEALDLDADGGDGQIDLMVSSEEANSIYLLQGEADGFDELIPIYLADAVKDVLAIDADRDGDKDLLYTAPESDTPFVLLRNDGNNNAGFMPPGMEGSTWSKQDVSYHNPPRHVTGGGLDGKEEDDDWATGAGNSDSALTGENTMTLEQTNFIFNDVGCTEDINNDGNVNVDDLLVLIGAWGSCSGCGSDINSDGSVDVDDLLLLIGAWGPCE